MKVMLCLLSCLAFMFIGIFLEEFRNLYHPHHHPESDLSWMGEHLVLLFPLNMGYCTQLMLPFIVTIIGGCYIYRDKKQDVHFLYLLAILWTLVLLICFIFVLPLFGHYHLLSVEIRPSPVNEVIYGFCVLSLIILYRVNKKLKKEKT